MSGHILAQRADVTYSALILALRILNAEVHIPLSGDHWQCRNIPSNSIIGEWRIEAGINIALPPARKWYRERQ